MRTSWPILNLSFRDCSFRAISSRVSRILELPVRFTCVHVVCLSNTTCTHSDRFDAWRLTGLLYTFHTFIGLREMKDAIFAWFQASAAVWMKSSLFWDVTQRRLVVTDVSGQSFFFDCLTLDPRRAKPLTPYLTINNFQHGTGLSNKLFSLLCKVNESSCWKPLKLKC